MKNCMKTTAMETFIIIVNEAKEEERLIQTIAPSDHKTAFAAFTLFVFVNYLGFLFVF